MKKNYTIILMVLTALLMSSAIYSQVLDSTVVHQYTSVDDSVRVSKKYFETYNANEHNLFTSKSLWETAIGWEASGEITSVYNSDNNIISFEEINNSHINDQKKEYTYSGLLLEQELIYSNMNIGKTVAPEWEYDSKKEYSYNAVSLANEIIVSKYIDYWQEYEKVKNTYNGSNQLITESQHSYITNPTVKITEDLFAEATDGTVYSTTAFMVATDDMSDLTGISIGDATSLSVYINDGSIINGDKRITLTGISGKTLEQALLGANNNEGITIDLTELRDDYFEWFKLEDGKVTLLNCNIKAQAVVTTTQAVEVTTNLFSTSGAHEYQNTAYLVKGIASMDDLSNIIIPNDIEWLNVYINDPDNSRIDIAENVAGQSLKTIFEANSITLDMLSDEYYEWFNDGDLLPTLVNLNVKAVKEITPVQSGDVIVYENLYNSGGADDYKNTAYNVGPLVTMSELANYTVSADTDFMNVYLSDNTRTDIDLSSTGETNLKQVLENVSIDISDLRSDYLEWFYDESGSIVLINLNIKGVKSLGSVPPVEVTEDLYASGSDEQKVTSYLVHSNAVMTDLSGYILTNIDFLNVYTNDGTNNVRYSLHGVAGKTLDVALTSAGNDEGVTIDLTELRYNYYEWFKDADGKPTLVNTNIRAVEVLEDQSIIETQNLYSESDVNGVEYVNTAYLVKETAVDADLLSYTFPVDIDWVNIYVKKVNPNDPDDNFERIDISTNVAGQTLKAVLDNNGITVAELYNNYYEWFRLGGIPTLVNLNIKGIKESTSATDLLTYENLYSTGATNKYKNTAFMVNTLVSDIDLSATVIPSNTDFLNVYMANGTTYSLHGVAGKTLKEVFDGGSTEGTNISKAQLKNTYFEWFEDVNGKPILLKINVKAVEDLGIITPVEVTEDLFTSGSDEQEAIAYVVHSHAVDSDLEAYKLIGVDFINVYTNNGTDNVRYTLTVTGRDNNLLQALNGGNDEGITINRSQLRYNYYEWFKDEDDKLTLVKTNIKAVRILTGTEIVDISKNLFSASGSKEYNNTAYSVKASNTMSDLNEIVFDDDIDWVNVYIKKNNPSDPDDTIDRIDISSNVAGQTLKTVLEANSITIDMLSDAYFEWFQNGIGVPTLTNLNIKAVKEITVTPSGEVFVYDNLYNSGGTDDYENTAYMIGGAVIDSDLSTYTVAADAQFLNVYTTSGRVDLTDIAGKTLQAVFGGDNDAGTTINIADLKADYREWFYNENGKITLINLNVKAVKSLGATPKVEVTEDLSTTGSVDQKATAYLVHSNAVLSDLASYTLTDIDLLNVYTYDGVSNVRYSLHGVAGKTLDVALTSAGNDEGVTIDLTELRYNYYEWFKDADGKLTLVKTNIKAVENVPEIPVEVTEKLLSESSENGIVYRNTSYLVKESATESDLDNYTLASDIDFINVYTHNGTDKIRYVLTGVAGKTLKVALTSAGNVEGIDIPISELIDNYYEWFFNEKGDRELVNLNIKAVMQLTQVDRLKQTASYTYNSNNVTSKVVIEFNELGVPTGNQEKTEYAYNSNELISEEVSSSIDHGATFLEKSKKEYLYDDLLTVVSNYTYSSSYTLNNKEFNYYEGYTLDVDNFDILSTSIYPNPVINILNIVSENQQEIQYEIYDVLGRLFLKGKDLGSSKIDVSSLSEGVYFVRIKSGDKLYSKKIIK